MSDKTTHYDLSIKKAHVLQSWEYVNINCIYCIKTNKCHQLVMVVGIITTLDFIGNCYNNSYRIRDILVSEKIIVIGV